MKRCIRKQIIKEVIIDVDDSFSEYECLKYIEDNNIKYEKIMVDVEEVPYEDSYLQDI